MVGRVWNSRAPSYESGAASIGTWPFLLMSFIATGIFNKIFSLLKRANLSFSFIL